jgi:plasmid stabilization system protein ParE
LNALRYHEAAEYELLTAVGYLEARGDGLGRRFLDEVQRVERLIIEFPEAGAEVKPGIRKRLLRAFRYSMIYSIESDGPLIIAVAHQSRRPDYWLGRIE